MLVGRRLELVEHFALCSLLCSLPQFRLGDCALVSQSSNALLDSLQSCLLFHTLQVRDGRAFGVLRPLGSLLKGHATFVTANSHVGISSKGFAYELFHNLDLLHFWLQHGRH